MSLMERIFGARPPQQAPQQGVTNNPTQNPPPAGTQQSQQTAPNGVVPEGSNNAPAGQSPADKFADLWEPAKQDESNNGAAQQGLTPEKMLEAASKVDFKRVLDQESLAKIAAGGDGAIEALANLLNKTSQTVYGQSTVVAQKLIESEVAKARQEFLDQIPGLVKKQTMRESLLTDNPAFKKPSVAPIVEAIQAQLAQKNPKATAAELNAMAKEYLQIAAQDFAPAPPKVVDPTKEATDWDEYVTGGNQ